MALGLKWLVEASGYKNVSWLSFFKKVIHKQCPKDPFGQDSSKKKRRKYFLKPRNIRYKILVYN
jgi:hypothetical protein